VHYFLTSLLDLYISQELFDWIIELYPREVIPEDDDSTSSSSSSVTSSGSSQSSTTSEQEKSEQEKSDKNKSEQEKSDKNKSEQEKSDKNKSENDELLKDLTLSYTTSDSSSESTSDSSSETTSNSISETTSDSEQLYISEGRLINGTEDVFKLPSPLDLLKHGFFENFTFKPNDFDESNAIYFKAGF
jgi:hypothetical protein